jgi:hypothetical protein
MTTKKRKGRISLGQVVEDEGRRTAGPNAKKRTQSADVRQKDKTLQVVAGRGTKLSEIACVTTDKPR